MGFLSGFFKVGFVEKYGLTQQKGAVHHVKLNSINIYKNGFDYKILQYFEDFQINFSIVTRL